MTPTSNIDLKELTEVEEADEDYKLDDGVIIGKVKGIEHLKQKIFWALNTERYNHIIYDWQIGIETMDLFGMPMTYVCSELESRIKDCLSIFKEIEDVYDFEFDTSSLKRAVVCTFRIKTTYGEIEFNKEVDY